jgi:arginine repressor
MTITKPELLNHIAQHPGQTKAELAENLSSPGVHVTLFHIAGMLQELVNSRQVLRYTDNGRQVYKAVSSGYGPGGSAA